MPGYLALRAEPRFLEKTISRIPLGVVAVSGSNGKSTTTNMLTAIFREHGLRVFTNPSGANLPQGIASAVLSEVSLTGKLDADIAILEMDEAYGVRLSELLKPRTVLLLNIQIDQLNRFFEPDRVAGMLRTIASSASEAVVLNRDDDYLADLGRSLPSTDAEISWFGADPAVIAAAPHGIASATRHGATTAEARPAASVTVTALDGPRADLSIDGTSASVALPSRGLHYAIDAAAAAETARVVLGDRFRPELVTSALASMKTVYGRGELLKTGDGDDVEIIMMKNPASMQMNLDSLEEAPEQVFLAIDEGTPDPSWIYDTDFGVLDHADVVSGSKGWQLAVRLGYSDIPVGTVEPDLRKAVQRFLALPRTESGRKTMIVNYEQMMLIRRLLGYSDLEGKSDQ
jgi:UDP-N-acetylmuramyl pentapeptide synthase